MTMLSLTINLIIPILIERNVSLIASFDNCHFFASTKRIGAVKRRLETGHPIDAAVFGGHADRYTTVWYISGQALHQNKEPGS